MIVDQRFLTANSLAAGGPPLGVGDPLPGTPLIDQSGRPFSLAGLRGRAVVLSFVYSRCQDPRECPLISAHYHQLQQRLRGQRVALVAVTLDPVYDTPPVLAKYGRTFGQDTARWTLATGDPLSVLRLASRLGVTAVADPADGLIHTERTVLAGPDGRIRMLIDEANWDPEEIVTAMRSIVHPNSTIGERFDRWLSAQAIAMFGSRVTGVPGLLDLGVVVALVAAVGWIFVRLARGIFAA